MQHDSNGAQQASETLQPHRVTRWRHRKRALAEEAIARRQQEAQQEIERRQLSMTWRQDLIDGYILALGGPDRVTAIQRQDAERAADMTALALNMRRRALRGDATVKIDDLTRLEGAADRAVRRLNLPAASTAAVAVPSLHDHAAKRALERANPQPAEEAD